MPAFPCLKIEVARSGAEYTAVLDATGGGLHLSRGGAAAQTMKALHRGVPAFTPTAMDSLDTEIFRLFFCGLTSTCRRGLRRCWRRRGQILPRGAAPEVIGAQAYRWTCAVFGTALLRHLPQVSNVMRVWTQMGVGVYRAWSPSEGSMRVWGALGYRIQMLQPCAVPQTLDQNIAWRLFEPCVPAPILDWLRENQALMAELRACRRGSADPARVIGRRTRMPPCMCQFLANFGFRSKAIGIWLICDLEVNVKSREAGQLPEVRELLCRQLNGLKCKYQAKGWYPTLLVTNHMFVCQFLANEG